MNPTKSESPTISGPNHTSSHTNPFISTIRTHFFPRLGHGLPFQCTQPLHVVAQIAPANPGMRTGTANVPHHHLRHPGAHRTRDMLHPRTLAGCQRSFPETPHAQPPDHFLRTKRTIRLSWTPTSVCQASTSSVSRPTATCSRSHDGNAILPHPAGTGILLRAVALPANFRHAQTNKGPRIKFRSCSSSCP